MNLFIPLVGKERLPAMRERTTWNRQEIVGGASGKTAEDPRAMNQDHLDQQPSEDKYLTGGPSEFAEDVAPPDNSWKVEQEGGETKRDEIGLPDFRDNTFRLASDEETLTKKAEVCVKLAKDILGNVDESIIEDQAFSFMHLPDLELVETATRLAKGKVPPEFLEQQKGKGDEDKSEKGDKDKDEKGQQKDASTWSSDVVQAMQAGDQEAVQAAIQDMVQSMMAPVQQQRAQYQQAQQQQRAQHQQAQQQQRAQHQQDQQQIMAEQVQQMIQQAVQQAQQQVGQECQGCDNVVSDEDQMIDDMLQVDPEVEQDTGIQLEGTPMDIGEVGMDEGDEILGQLFASNPEVQQAQQAQALQTGVPVQPTQVQAGVRTASTRTASTRTVGTQPTGGVSQIGGAASPGNGGNGDVDKLSSLWRSAPDVSDVFNG